MQYKVEVCNKCGSIIESFNSLFEMLVVSVRVVVVVIGVTAFNSLFEMRCWLGRLQHQEAPVAFNSLFEMHVILMVIVSAIWPSFNSLFEMRYRPAEVEVVKPLQLLSILYLRCPPQYVPK